ncbi:Glycosyl hydrolase family 63 C-terminal domain-containing protein [Saccharicrinis carchari]|uniref:Glycosyl hydrolase family 63 C-terminal domain-containing protein n=1 Tax=Saccharicrinis carchari TaxID=1168039 RepID=A0A521EKH3_SACCC|nr:glucosidase [Saccharicrinis carchari]SMO84417.1 Glycosyl hydrolase family 63 C-terminal domain-containing protein [Saccharicrinis carchari]
MKLQSEKERLNACSEGISEWKKWGPYLSERQWGTVREDDGRMDSPWLSFTHDQARSRVYRYGEDGIAGISDDKQQLCFALSLWNKKDKILKERLFGLSSPKGNHGEDVKEYYFYLDSSPTHSYMKYLYKYPLNEFPYDDLVDTNAARTVKDFEYELLDTGVFENSHYLDVYIEYAKKSCNNILIKITAFNRSTEDANVVLLPTLWFRNTWWNYKSTEPIIKLLDDNAIIATSDGIGSYVLSSELSPLWLFTNNETNNERIYNSPNKTPYVKDGLNDFIVNNNNEAVNPENRGTKAGAMYDVNIPAGESIEIKMVLKSGKNPKHVFDKFDQIVETRINETEAFYQNIYPSDSSIDEKRVLRQALAGMLWNKQYYEFDVSEWLDEYQGGPRRILRNNDWEHLKNNDIISMPDKWEYPWYAVWDLAFHTLPLTMVDPDFAKNQLTLFLQDNYQHPNGQIPAYEWSFNDVNPPVHAFGVITLYKNMKQAKGLIDKEFLKTCFDGLDRNFKWWVNHKDPRFKSAFQGGFLGLDNIGVFDRSHTLPTGGHIEQSDGNAWMALYAQNMLEICLELVHLGYEEYEDKSVQYYNHFLEIASAMDKIGDSEDEMWDEEDQFFYDVLRFPDGSAQRLKVRSLVGLLPMCAVTVLEPERQEMIPTLAAHHKYMVTRTKRLSKNIADPQRKGKNGRRLLGVVNESKLRSILKVMLDEEEFLSDYGIRSLSKYHEKNPYVFTWNKEEFTVKYVPGESDNTMFGGNSNWRGPIWFPANSIIIRALYQQYAFYGDDLKVECPTGSGNMMNLIEVAQEIIKRLENIFLEDEDGYRPVYGWYKEFQKDEHWENNLLFYEYFHGDNGAGIGASHQTGWTGMIAYLMVMFRTTDFDKLLEKPHWDHEVTIKPESEENT